MPYSPAAGSRPLDLGFNLKVGDDTLDPAFESET